MIYGMTSACAAVVGSVGTYLTGVVLDTTDSWAMVFQVSRQSGRKRTSERGGSRAGRALNS